VIAHVAETNDLGIVALRQPAEEGAWWRGLGGPAAPLVMAVLPYIDIGGRSADLPSLVLSPPLADPAPAELAIVAVTGKPPRGGKVLAEAGDDRLVAVPADAVPAGAAMLGGIARGIAIDGPGSLLYEKSASQGKKKP
jgi:hypothetical protein